MTFRDLLGECARMLAPVRRPLASIVSIQAFGAVLYGLIDPLILTATIDRLSKGDREGFAALVALSVVLLTTYRGLDYMSRLTSSRVSNELTERNVAQAFDALCRQPHAAVVSRDQGYYVSRVYDEPAKVAEVAELLSALVQSSLVAIGALSACVWLAWQVTPAFVLVVPVLALIGRALGRRISAATTQANEQEAVLRGDIRRSVGAHKTLLLFGLAPQARKTVLSSLGGLLATKYSAARDAGRLSTASGLFLAYAEIGVLATAGLLVLSGGLTVGGLFGFTAAFWRVVNASRGMTDLIPLVAVLKGRLERVQEFDGTGSPDALLPVVRRDVHAGYGVPSISVSNASFSYGDALVFDDVSLSVGPRERVLLTGENGSGKSTLGHIAAGLLSPTEGDVRSVSVERTSALLLPFGFAPGTGYDNLKADSLSERDAERLDTIATRFQLTGKLERDPETLSQGEQRKLQVLMALMKPADAYVFDEPLSNVDVESRSVVMDEILNGTMDASLLVILHGDEHLTERFDRIVRLGGRAEHETVPAAEVTLRSLATCDHALAA